MEKEPQFNFENLLVYKKTLDMIDSVYRCTDSFPHDELFGLRSQFRRAAVSVSLNIAEGSARSKKDFRRFLDVAQGSIFECVAVLNIGKRQKIITDETAIQIKLQLSELSKMISGLKRSMGFADRNES